MPTRKQMIQFMAIALSKTVQEIEAYFIGKPDEYVYPMFKKHQELAEVRDADFLAA